MPIPFGFANIHPDIPGAGPFGYREHWYERKAGKIVWPSCNGPLRAAWPPGDGVGFYTIYPPPRDLLAGKLDGKIRALAGSAPPHGGLLTAYAEADADAAHGGQFAKAGLSKAQLADVHAHLHALCKGTHVRYGPVICGVSNAQLSFCPPGMDWYGIDWYHGSRHGVAADPRHLWNPPVLHALNTWRAGIGRIQPHPVLAIAETNAGDPAARPHWFALVYAWLAAYSLENGGGHAAGFYSYWRTDPGTGSLSGPWLPQDTATVNALADLAAHAKIT